MRRSRVAIRAFLLCALLAAGASAAQAHGLPGVGRLLDQLRYLTRALPSAALAAESGQSARSLALGILREYSPTGYYILDRFNNLPAQYIYGERLDFMEFIEGDRPTEVAASLNTAVHEVCHAYTHAVALQMLAQRAAKPARGARYGAYYIGGEETILVQHTPVFAARETAGYFPEALRTFRFSTYISPSEENLGTQVEGIYGLLGEFTAYYHGTKTAVEMIGFFKNETAQAPEDWFKYFASVNGTFYSYLEFKLYILKYLQYARDKYPAIHRQILENREFKEAFLKIERGFAETLRRYFAAKQEIQALLRSKGCDVSESDEYLWVTQGVKRVGQTNYMRVYNQLEQELRKPEYLEPVMALGGP